jgi:hypothetical protein
MFDTVKLGISVLLTQQEIDAVHWTRTNSSRDSKRGETTTIFKQLYDVDYPGCPFIRYTYKEDDLTKSWLKVEVSVPAFLYGSNAYELEDGDIDIFYKMIRKYVASRLRIKVARIPRVDQCTIEKVHVCKNFDVGHRKHHYLKAMSMSTIAKFQKHHYCSVGSDKVESVEWRASKKKEKLYDKEAEIRQQKDYPDKSRHQERSRGILRYEVELSDQEIRQISPDRKAADVLKMEVAARILQKGLNRNGLSSGVKYSSHQQIIEAINRQSIPLRTKSALIAFATELLINGEDECRKKYAQSTFLERKSQIRAILGVRELLIGDKELPPLQVTTSQKKTVPVPAKQ